MGQEPRPECLDGALNPAAQLVERPGAILGRLLGPLLEEAVGRAIAVEARPVEDRPEEREVGEQLALEDRLKVELDERLTGQRRAVAEQP